MKKILVTGIAGFIGSHLSAFLLSKGHDIAGIDHPDASLPENFMGNIRFYPCDIEDSDTLRVILKEIQPDVIYHLAAIIKTNAVKNLYAVNVVGTTTLFDLLVELNFKPTVVVTSSSAVYGSGNGTEPIIEQCRLHPVTQYAISKSAQEFVAYRYFLMHQIPVLITRTFNLIGPGQPATLACSDFARQIARAEMVGQSAKIITGNISNRRDFIDVRDAVRAYELIEQYGTPGEVYNVCSGKDTSVKECLDVLMQQAVVSCSTQVNTSRYQLFDVPIQIGSAEKLNKLTGWTTQISLQKSLFDLLKYWRENQRNFTE